MLRRADHTQNDMVAVVNTLNARLNTTGQHLADADDVGRSASDKEGDAVRCLDSGE